MNVKCILRLIHRRPSRGFQVFELFFNDCSYRRKCTYFICFKNCIFIFPISYQKRPLWQWTDRNVATGWNDKTLKLFVYSPCVYVLRNIMINVQPFNHYQNGLSEYPMALRMEFKPCIAEFASKSAKNLS